MTFEVSSAPVYYYEMSPQDGNVCISLIRKVLCVLIEDIPSASGLRVDHFHVVEFV